MDFMGMGRISVDEETGEVTMKFMNACPVDHPNPVEFQPDKELTVVLQGGVITDYPPPSSTLA